MAKILKNTTTTPIDLDVLGLPQIPANGQLTIQEYDYLALSFEDSINFLDPLMTAGTIIVNDGVVDLTASEGREFIRYPDESDRIRIILPSKDSVGDFGPNQQSADTRLSVSTAIEGAAAASKVSASDTKFRYLENKIISGPGIVVNKQTDQETGEETLQLNATGTFEGKGFQVSYIGNGTVTNEWLKQEDQNVVSSQSPDIFKYKARLVGLDYSNNNRGTDPIIIFCIRNAGAANLNSIDRFYKWTLTNARSSVKTDQLLGFEIHPGDLMAVYVRDGGGNPNDMVISMDFIVLDATPQNITTNINGDFQSNDIPATNTITEVFT